MIIIIVGISAFNWGRLRNAIIALPSLSTSVQSFTVREFERKVALDAVQSIEECDKKGMLPEFSLLVKYNDSWFEKSTPLTQLEFSRTRIRRGL
jgi:hypothetical protein